VSEHSALGLIMNELNTYSSHEPSGVVSVNRALPWHPDSCDIALPTQKNWMYQGLGLIQIVEQENGGGNETKEDSQVIGYKKLR
jgi:hypothetical protein